jgi:hypothetical protein
LLQCSPYPKSDTYYLFSQWPDLISFTPFDPPPSFRPPFPSLILTKLQHMEWLNTSAHMSSITLHQILPMPKGSLPIQHAGQTNTALSPPGNPMQRHGAIIPPPWKDSKV